MPLLRRGWMSGCPDDRSFCQRGGRALSGRSAYPLPDQGRDEPVRGAGIGIGQEQRRLDQFHLEHAELPVVITDQIHPGVGRRPQPGRDQVDGSLSHLDLSRSRDVRGVGLRGEQLVDQPRPAAGQPACWRRD